MFVLIETPTKKTKYGFIFSSIPARATQGNQDFLRIENKAHLLIYPFMKLSV